MPCAEPESLDAPHRVSIHPKMSTHENRSILPSYFKASAPPRVVRASRQNKILICFMDGFFIIKCKASSCAFFPFISFKFACISPKFHNPPPPGRRGYGGQNGSHIVCDLKPCYPRRHGKPTTGERQCPRVHKLKGKFTLRVSARSEISEISHE